MKIAEVRSRAHDKRTRGRNKARVHFFIQSETVLENLSKRVNGAPPPYREYRKLLPEVLKRAGLPEDTKAAWSRKAGCSCGCSPGFVLDGPRGVDVFVDVN